jgi:hypothetical protein
VDWVTISALATAAGTLILAVATFASVRSANRAARTAERALLAGQRPLLVHSRPEDVPVKVGFVDAKWMQVPGGQAVLETSDDVIWLAVSVRNVGTGIAVLHGWQLYEGLSTARDRPEIDGFHRLSRDIYVAAGDTGFWQGSFRDRSRPDFVAAREAIDSRSRLTLDVLYGNYEGGQRVVSRFGLTPGEGDDAWYASVGRHWNIDQPDPRS